MSTASPIDVDPSPADLGWRVWSGHALVGHDPTDLVMLPATVHCSLRVCSGAPVAAVRRGSSGPRPPLWQMYCDRHAYERGVQVTPQGLAWTPEFISTGAPVRPDVSA
jgi:hypothetical protein